MPGLIAGNRPSGCFAQLSPDTFFSAEFGLLFCEPVLEPFYRAQGWRKIDVPVTMADEQGHCVPLPEENIAMILELADKPFPSGPVDLAGRDW